MQASIYHIAPFDAEIGGTIKFNWQGNQFFKNRCIIKKNETNEVVYDKTVDSFKYEHVIDISEAHLVNGEKYNAFITVFDKDGAESDIQAIGEHFLCLKTPSFQFTNITNGQVISTSSYQFILSYSQENGELLDSWAISVYTRSHTLLSTSGLNYQTDSMEYTFSGFSNKNEYSIKATGRTVNGIDVETDFINISISYSIRDVFSLLEPVNLKDIGAINIRSNIVSSEGHLKNTPAVYLDNEAIDLRDNELTYQEGFSFSGDFSKVILFYGCDYNKEFLYLYADDPDKLSGTVTYRVGHFGTSAMRACYELRTNSNGVHSVYYSNIIDIPEELDKVGLCITRINGFYNLQAANLGKVVAA